MQSRFLRYLIISLLILSLAHPADALFGKKKKAKNVSGVKKQFDLQAHRGGRGRIPPGNTLPAFEYALDLEVTTIELDLHETKDGEIIVIHDDFLSGEWQVASEAKGLAVPDPRTVDKKELSYDKLTLDQLKAYRCLLPAELAAVPGRNPETTQLLLDARETSIPTLREVFEFVKTYAGSSKKTDSQRENAARIHFNIETKATGFEQKVVDLVKEYQLEDRVTVQSFIHPSIAKISQLDPRIRTAALDGVPARIVKETKAYAWSPNYKDLSKKDVKHAHSMKLKVIPWTVNDAPSMERLIDFGVDGIITDYPDILKKILDRRKIPYKNIPPGKEEQKQPGSTK